MEKKFKAGRYASIVNNINILPLPADLPWQLFINSCLCDSLVCIHALSPFFTLFFQKAFHEDVSSVMRRWLKDEELLPDHQKVTSRAQTHYIKVSLCGA